MKNLLLSAVLCLSLSANINEAVLGIIGEEDYNTHKNLINHIFKEKNSFYTNGTLDYTKISQELKNNKLLKLDLNSIKELDISFFFNSSPKKSFKNINDILRTLGYQNFITIKQISLKNQLKWRIKLQSAAAINPLRLSSELQSINCRIVDIKKEGNNKWSYYIDSSKSSLYKAEDLVSKTFISLRKPIKPYIIELAYAKELYINSLSSNTWFPKIVFYDDEFKILEVFESDTLHSSLRIEVPYNTRFVKIDDFYALTNIKNGLTITKE